MNAFHFAQQPLIWWRKKTESYSALITKKTTEIFLWIITCTSEPQDYNVHNSTRHEKHVECVIVKKKQTNGKYCDARVQQCLVNVLIYSNLFLVNFMENHRISCSMHTIHRHQCQQCTHIGMITWIMF